MIAYNYPNETPEQCDAVSGLFLFSDGLYGCRKPTLAALALLTLFGAWHDTLVSVVR